MSRLPGNRRKFLCGGAALAGLTAMSTAPGAQVDVSSRRTYLVVFRPGPQWLQGKPLSAQPLRAHGAYMLELYRRGTLRIAGGFADDSGGAAVFDADDEPTARQLMAADPAVTAGVFVFQLQRWGLVDWAAMSASK